MQGIMARAQRQARIASRRAAARASGSKWSNG